ncbi:MAG: response regulator [Deltaproteobacteria bacterium]|nr:response regulator [Deltaproteobacteria bacterium]
MSDSLYLSGRKLIGKVLLVEDDLQFGGWLQAHLNKIGLNCHWKTNLTEALQSFENELFHAVITDIFLTSGNLRTEGLEIVKAIRTSGTPCIIMSSAADLRIAKEAINQGASYLLEKPFEMNELFKALENMWEEPKGLQAILERFLDIHKLTPKEKEVARLVVKGLANKEIAAVEAITDRTIKAHLTSIFQKCKVTTRTELFNAIFPT